MAAVGDEDAARLFWLTGNTYDGETPPVQGVHRIYDFYFVVNWVLDGGINLGIRSTRFHMTIWTKCCAGRFPTRVSFICC